jgi:hypothetical protein
MYLDANGDGVHTEADVLPSSGVTSVDVWIVTDKTRLGADVTCTTEPEVRMTINSYEVILHATGGTVRYGAFENLQIPMSTRFGLASDSTDLYAGFGGGTILPPGTYHLGRVTIEAASGTPSVGIAARTPLDRWYETAFGCSCSGNDYDNTLKLGTDWFDADGLLPPGTVAGAPRFEPPPSVSIAEGETFDGTIVATDSESDSLTLTVLEKPVFVSFGALQSSPGRVESPFHVAPGYSDAGSARLRVLASDGLNQTTLVFYVVVANVNHLPRFDPMPDLTVEFGTTTDQPVVVHDTDNEYVATTIRRGPEFATIESTPGTYHSVVHLRPGPSDVGRSTVVLRAWDGFDAVEDSFLVDVLAESHFSAPVFDSIPDFVVPQMAFRTWTIVVYDADGTTPQLSLGGAPPFIWLQPDFPEDWPPPGTARARLVIAPYYQTPPQEWTLTITASDGVLSSHRSFRVAVVDSEFAPIIALPYRCVAQGELSEYRPFISDLDGDLVSATFGPPPSWGSAIDLSPLVREYTFAPTSGDPPQEFPIEIVAVDGAGHVTRVTQVIELTAPGDCDMGGPFAGGDPGMPPTPRAGGPYAGVAGAAIRFDGSGTLEGLGCSFTWAFGDQSTALGRTMSHRYLEGGVYRAILTVRRQGSASAFSDTTVVTVRDALPARAFLPPEERPIVLRAERALVTARMERIGEEFALEDLDPSSLCLWTPGNGDVDSIFAQAGKTARVEDRDGNGVPERTVAFAREDVRRLLSNVRGKHTIAARLEGRLPSGARVRAPIELEILGTPTKGVAIWPNPLNPRGTISFQAARPGKAVLRLYDVNGRLVRTLLNGNVDAGEVQVPFDGLDSRGRSLGSGVYFYTVRTQDGEWQGRATILK